MPCLEKLTTDHCPKLKGKRPFHILTDTPWFRDTYPNGIKEDKEASERNIIKLPSQKPMKCSSRPYNYMYEEYKKEEYEGNKRKPPPSQKKRLAPEDNKTELQDQVNAELYTRFKKSVLDAYSTDEKQTIEMIIPKADLGHKKDSSYYFPVKDLHDWLKDDGSSMFSQKLFLWKEMIYDRMTPSDLERVQIVRDALVTAIGEHSDPDKRSKEIAEFMIKNIARLYLVPMFMPDHWELLAIVPETRKVDRFDSLQKTASAEHKKFINMVEGVSKQKPGLYNRT